jgi:hypothetical protein
MAFATLDLISPLPRDECVRQLRERTGCGWLPFGPKAVVGRVGRRSLCLRKRIYYASSFQSILFASLVDDGRQTRLHCRFGMHPFVMLFIAWFVVAIMFGGAPFVDPIVRELQGDGPSQAWMDPIARLGLLLFTGALVAFGRFLARNEREFLENFLYATIDARPA